MIDYSEAFRGLKRHEPVNEEIYLFATAAIKQQFDDYGNHRLTAGPDHTGHWVPYAFIARLSYHGTEYGGTTEYYDGNLPRVFAILAGRP